MKTAVVTWLDGLAFDAEARGHHVTVDTDGDEGRHRGPTPVELLLMSLACCSGMDVVSILKKKRQPITGVRVRAEGERAADHPRRFERIHLAYEVSGPGVERAAAERAVELSKETYCSVSATLSAEITVSVEIVDDSAVEAES